MQQLCQSKLCEGEWNIFFLHVCMLQHAWPAATQFAMQDLGGRAMSVKTSKTLIDELLAADLGKRHFSVWTSKEQHEAIRRCGLASSQFKNRTESTAILTHLHTTDLPTDHLAVLHLIAELGLPPSGARSKQQFSFYLLSFMCDKLDFPVCVMFMSARVWLCIYFFTRCVWVNLTPSIHICLLAVGSRTSVASGCSKAWTSQW